ncbi:MAG TPA: PAS domain-containing protein, partial [Candidatus Saccharimonadales bacterium]|nr:PAS domain-containing protein [Candidatus Saccharimonadales bacterium]
MIVPGHRFAYELPDFRNVFEQSPDLNLIVDARFTIVAATDAYCAATMVSREDILGRALFEVFPDNPDDSAADGVTNLRTSLLNVIKFRIPDRMPEQKYDI